MKKLIYIIPCIILVFLSSITAVSAQNLGQKLSDLKNKITDVQIDKTSYKQSIEILDEQKAKIKFTSVQVDDKGKTSKTSYEFYISDIDKNTIIRKTEGKKLMVSLSVNNKQKFIKLLKEDQLDSYVENVELLVSDSETAQSVIEIVKTAIPLVKSGEKAWSSANEALLWLKNNIKDVAAKTGSVAQSFTFNEKKNYLVNLTTKSTDSKGASVEEQFDFNILDINKTKIMVKVSGTLLSVSLETKNSDKYIRYTKKGELQSYAGNTEINAEDIDQARNIISAFNSAIEKSKAILPEFKSVQQATDFIKANVGDVTIDSKTIKQKIDFSSGNGTKTSYTREETDSKGKVIPNVYMFYLADIDPAGINFKVSGKKLTLFLSALNKTKLIKYSKDNIPQNYEYDIDLFHTDIETLRQLVLAFTFAAKESVIPPAKWTSLGEVSKFLESAVAGENIGQEQYKLSFDLETSEPYPCEYTKTTTDAKGITTEEKYLFYPYMLDPASVKIGAEGKYLIVSSTVKSKKSYVKKSKKDANSFGSEIEIMAFDAKQAKDIAEAMKYLAATAIPKEKNWSNKEAAMKFVTETVGNFSNAGKEVKQKFELVNNEPCKVNFTVSTIDNKGKTLEEIYEFSLNDMNKLMVDYKTQGGNVFITMTCKNKEKLIKVYKNGAQQAYGSVIEIIEDDIETAKNLADALRNSIINCE